MVSKVCQIWSDKYFAVFRGIYQNNPKTYEQNLVHFSSTSGDTLTFGDVSTEWEINSNQWEFSMSSSRFDFKTLPPHPSSSIENQTPCNSSKTQKGLTLLCHGRKFFRFWLEPIWNFFLNAFYFSSERNWIPIQAIANEDYKCKI